MSTKSECGVDGTRPVSWMGGSVDTTRRNWCSESQLERRDHQAGAGRLQAAGHKPFKALSLNTLLKVRFIKETKKKKQKYPQPVLGLAGPGMMEKEKTKTAEVNTMGSIKEVNESDISEANSPNPTPRLKDQRLVELVINGVGG